MAPTAQPQCGGGPVVEEVEDKPQEQERKEHCWTCTDEFHCRGEVERSREKFDWKVVEPYDGMVENKLTALNAIKKRGSKFGTFSSLLGNFGFLIRTWNANLKIFPSEQIRKNSIPNRGSPASLFSPDRQLQGLLYYQERTGSPGRRWV